MSEAGDVLWVIYTGNWSQFSGRRKMRILSIHKSELAAIKRGGPRLYKTMNIARLEWG